MKTAAQYMRESRARRAAAGGKLIHIMLTQEATLALDAWTRAGYSIKDAVCAALMASKAQVEAIL